jgi:hypothetical protein
VRIFVSTEFENIAFVARPSENHVTKTIGIDEAAIRRILRSVAISGTMGP